MRDAPSASPPSPSSGELTANWKSALCVTSLYDAYVALQHENDALQAQVAELTQHKRELLTASDSKCADSRTDAVASDSAELLHEIALLRTENERAQLALAQQRQHSEARVRELDAQITELAAKYEQRYTLDPNSDKRVGLAVRTLQESLEAVVQEKEELGLRYTKLQQLYNRVQQEQQTRVTTLQAHVQALEMDKRRRLKKTVVDVLQQWYVRQLTAVWTQWRATNAYEKVQEHEQHTRQSFENQLRATDKQRRNQQAARASSKSVANATRRSFLVWRAHTKCKQHTQTAVSTFCRRSTQRRLSAFFSTWKSDAQARTSHRQSLKRLERVLTTHWKRTRWRRWTERVFIHDTVAELTEQLASRSRDVTALQSDLEGAVNRLAVAELENAELVAQVTYEQRAATARVSTKHAIATALVDRIDSFFAKQNRRQLEQRTLAAWTAAVTARRVLQTRTTSVQTQLAAKRTRRAVVQWRVTTEFQRRVTHVVAHIVARMRRLSVLQCFSAWRALCDNQHARAATIRNVLRLRTYKHTGVCFTRWRAFRVCRHEMRARLETMLTTVVAFQQAKAFRKWRERVVTAAAAAVAETQLALQREWELRFERAKADARVLRSCLLHWQQFVQHLTTRKQLVATTRWRWRTTVLAAVLNDWQRFGREQRRQRTLVSRWLRRLSTASLRRAWMMWQTGLLRTTQLEALIHVQDAHDSVVARLQREIFELHAAHESRLAATNASSRELQSDLERVQQTREANARRQQTLANAVVQLTTRQTHARLQRRSFQGWASHVSTSKRVLTVACRVQHRRVVVAFHVWRYRRQQRALFGTIMRMLRSFADQHSVRLCFVLWCQATETTQSVHRLRSRCQEKRRQQMLYDVVRAWQHETRQRVLVRRTVERVWLPAVRRHIHKRFATWAAASQQQRLAERKTQRKRLLVSIQSRVRTSWTRCSTRGAFAAWRARVRRLRQCREAGARLCTMWATHLLRIGVDCLRVNAACVCEQRRRVQRLVEKLLRQVHTHAFGRWKAENERCRRQEIDTLRRSHARLERDLVESREEASQLARASTAVDEALAKTTEANERQDDTIQTLARERILMRYVSAWQRYVRETQFVARLVQRLASDARTKRLRACIARWQVTLADAERRRRLAAVQRERRDHASQRSHLLAWRTRTHDQRQLKHRLCTAAERRATRSLDRAFQRWCAAIALHQTVRTWTPRLDALARRLRLCDAVDGWRRVNAATKRAEASEIETQQRIVAFTMRRQVGTLERAVSSWRARTMAKRTARTQSDERFASKCQHWVGVVYTAWQREVHCRQAQRTHLAVLSRNLERRLLRLAIAVWNKRLLERTLDGLRATTAAHARELDAVHRQLEVATERVHDAQSAVLTRSERISVLEALLATASADATRTSQRHHDTLLRVRAVVRLVRVTSVSRALLAAFARWKTRCEVLQSYSHALERLTRWLRHKQRARGFQRWQTATRMVARLERVRQRVTMRHVRTVFDAWMRHYGAATRTLMRLVRLCGVLYAHDAQRRWTVRGAFHVLRQHSVAAETAKRLALLTAAVDHDARACRVHCARLRLATWSWRAYTVRLHAFHRFFLRCRRESSRQQMRQWQRRIETLETAQALQTAQLETQQAESARAAAVAIETAVDERSVVNACLPGLRTLFRHLATVTSTNELFATIASVFPQQLHGSSGAPVGGGEDWSSLCGWLFD